MKKSKKFLIASGIGVAAGALITAFMKKRKAEQGEYLTSDGEEEMYLDFSENALISYEEAEKKAIVVAIEKLGKDAKVVSASDKKTLPITAGGGSRHCYMFGAVGDDLSINPEALLLYVDSSSGEVFDSNDIK